MEIKQKNQKPETIKAMLKLFYNPQMKSIIILTWTWGIIIAAGAIASAIAFTQTTQTRSQIMYAALFLTCIIYLAMLKIFAWQIIHRRSLQQDIQRLEEKIDNLTRTITPKS